MNLLANYNRLERPVVNDSAAIVVELGLTLLQIIDVVGSCIQLHSTCVCLCVKGMTFGLSQYRQKEEFVVCLLTGSLSTCFMYLYCIHPGIYKISLKFINRNQTYLSQSSSDLRF